MMENKDELCGGVKILIERMKSHPEEFADIDSTLGQHKWNGVMSSSMWDKNVTCWDDVLTPAEVEALKEARANIMRAKFTNLVMARLLKDQDEQKAEAPYPSGGYFVSTGAGGGGGTGILGHGLRVSSPNLAQNAYNPYQTIATMTSDTSILANLTQQKANSLGIGHLIKKTLGIK
jgi:hypothetical protein